VPGQNLAAQDVGGLAHLGCVQRGEDGFAGSGFFSYSFARAEKVAGETLIQLGRIRRHSDSPLRGRRSKS
jgi:hypothetical protein